MPVITLNQLAIALLGAGAYIYPCTSRGGYWKVVSSLGGQRIERNHPDPYAALAAVAAVQLDYEAAQTCQDLSRTPAARAAFRAAWAATAGPPAARFAAAEAAAALADDHQLTAEADDPDESEACYRHEMARAYWHTRLSY